MPAYEALAVSPAISTATEGEKTQEVSSASVPAALFAAATDVSPASGSRLCVLLPTEGIKPGKSVASYNAEIPGDMESVHPKTSATTLSWTVSESEDKDLKWLAEGEHNSLRTPRGCRLRQSSRLPENTYCSADYEGSEPETNDTATENGSSRDSIRVQVFEKLQQQREQQEWEVQQALERQASSLRQQLASLRRQLKAQQQESLLQQELLQQRESALQAAAAEAAQLRTREQQLRQEREALRRAHAELQTEVQQEQLSARSQRASAALEWAKKLTQERETFAAQLQALQSSKEACADSAKKLHEEVLQLRQQLRAAAASHHSAAAASGGSNRSLHQQIQQQQQQQQQQQGSGIQGQSDKQAAPGSGINKVMSLPQTPRGSSSGLPMLPLASPRMLRMHLSQQQQQQQQQQRQSSEIQTLPSLADELQSIALSSSNGCSSNGPLTKQLHEQQQAQMVAGDFIDLEAGLNGSSAAPSDDCCTKQLNAFTRLLLFLWSPFLECPKRNRARRDSL
ncbi:hypothetical protein, conserved [Eimeria tenella]|uniref:Uncharacterized protein n=1 Tax=Eimeria tenella TaxID=5802 RepID=U6L0J2_EIMTE|nr:hypothetical protein, conserved [Eimeria tenella]CDJ42099.1 hypothetical protein, conserved [Eimeria tenella]|eukprot:XP_013232849.1 hypothetical protein, conserved [Eimeria tenella]